MFAQARYPESLSPVELDQFLERGWFRMGQSIFTTNFLNFKNQFYSAIWLRVDLSQFEGDNRLQKLLKTNSGFSVTIQQATLDHEKEDLYARYKASISFQASPSLDHLLFSRAVSNIYNTFEINVRHNTQLIACGFFDVGRKSAAGIASFYDPEYKKYSLGKYMIYLKMLHCKKLGFRYFYPGYFVPGYKLFDYKLDIGRQALEFLEMTSSQWHHISVYSGGHNPLGVMQQKLNDLKLRLTEYSINSLLFRYEHFDVNLLAELKGVELFDFPVFLHISSNVDDMANHVIVYDPRDRNYRFLHCRSVWISNQMKNTNDMYSLSLLQQEDVYYQTPDLEDMLERLVIVFVPKQKYND